MYTLTKFFLIFSLSLTFFFTLSAEKNHTAELNPEFLKYKNSSNKSSYRLIPSPVKVAPYMKAVVEQNTQLPSKFDLRDEKRVPSVRDQGSYYTCWLFSASGSFESILLPDVIYNMSEKHANENHGFDLGRLQGGTAWMTTAYFVRWDGPYAESVHPYYPSRSTPEESASVPSWHVQNVFIAPDRSNGLDNTVIKEIIMNKGAIDFALFWEDPYYKKSASSYYYNHGKGQNHRMTMVGWDDNYSADNFINKPPGNGAFIARNSWGGGWGFDGYCYISYYDTSLEEFFCYHGIEKNSNYYNIYQYDKLGVTKKVGNGYNMAANIFTATDEENLKAAGFYTLAMDTEVEIWAYTGVSGDNPTSGSPVYYNKYSIKYPGFHTKNFESEVPLKKGDRFSIVVKLSSPHSSFNIAIESPDGDYSSKADAQYGQSFISTDGVKWRDLCDMHRKSNYCVKAYTGIPIPEVVLTGQLIKSKSWIVNINRVELEITLKESPITIDKIEIVNTNEYGRGTVIKTADISEGQNSYKYEYVPDASVKSFIYHINLYSNGKKLGESKQLHLK